MLNEETLFRVFQNVIICIKRDLCHKNRHVHQERHYRSKYLPSDDDFELVGTRT